MCAWHPAGPPRFPDSRVPSSLLLRFAQPDDEGVLLRLYRDELRFHEACGPFANNSAGARLGFGHKLTLAWAGASLEQGAPLVIVAVLQGQVVGIAQASLLEVLEEDEPGYTPPTQQEDVEGEHRSALIAVVWAISWLAARRPQHGFYATLLPVVKN